MPLLDHFYPPLSVNRKWEGFHGQWASCIAAALNSGLLPEHHFADMQVTMGQIEVDVPTQAHHNGQISTSPPPSSGGVATLVAPAWAPPAPSFEMNLEFVDGFTVLVINTEGGPTLVGAIELVSPSKKDRPSARHAFATKCLNLGHNGIGLIVVDVVTARKANLHDEMTDLLGGEPPKFPDTPSIYTAAYRPFRRGEDGKVAVWTSTLKVGEWLPSMLLWLRDQDTPVCVELEATYCETRSRCGMP